MIVGRLGTTRTTNPGSRNEKQRGYFISVITALKAVLIRLAIWVSLTGGVVSEHIDRLARRDEDYVRRKYSLTPDQLIEGAIIIAVLFAENRNLSLAPTQTEIAAELNSNCIPGGNLENMLGALQDVKIGRSDVQEARAGDRRFTFSHRRYQETLFVRHLTKTANYLTPHELLTDTRWREYSVTLLQTQDLAIISQC